MNGDGGGGLSTVATKSLGDRIKKVQRSQLNYQASEKINIDAIRFQILTLLDFHNSESIFHECATESLIS